MGKGQSKSHIVIFVEGDTDQIFFEGLCWNTIGIILLLPFIHVK